MTSDGKDVVYLLLNLSEISFSVNELVKHGENGFVFHNAKELGEQLQDWFSNFPNNSEQIELNNTFKKNLENYQELRWKQNWDLVAYNTFC